MDIEAVTESIWAHTLRRSYFPAEWKGRLTIEQAYRVQLGLLDRWVARGERLAGWKVGLTAPVIQRQFGMHEPVMGFLLESGHRESGAVFRHGELIEPGFENELCLTSGCASRDPASRVPRPGPRSSLVQPAFEIIEGRGDFRADLTLGPHRQLRSRRRSSPGRPARCRPDGSRAARRSKSSSTAGGSTTPSGARRPATRVGAVAWLANKLADVWPAPRGRTAGSCRVRSPSSTRSRGGTGSRPDSPRSAPSGPLSTDVRPPLSAHPARMVPAAMVSASNPFKSD